MKKKVVIITGIIIILILLASKLFAAESLTAKSSSTKDEIKEQEEIIITLRFDEYKGINKGINAYKATIEYSKDIWEELEEEDFICQNDWESLKYNKSNGKFVAIKKAGSYSPEDIVKVTLKAKKGIKAGTTEIKIKNIVTSNGEKDIEVEDASSIINIIEEQSEIPDTPKEEKISSEKYNIEAEYITRIVPTTTVTEFKQNVTLENVTTNPQMIFTDEEGRVLEEDSKIKTGTKLKVGNTLNYTLVVIGDTDKDAELTVNDLAEVKLHLIDKSPLEGINAKAADIDNDNEITVNDLAQMKLVLINLLTLEK